MEEQDKQELMKRAETFAATQSVDKAMAEIGVSGKETQDGLKEQIEQEKAPDKKEQKQRKKKVRNILNGYRNNVLEQIDVENYKKFCELAQIRAESDKKLDAIKRQEAKRKKGSGKLTDLFGDAEDDNDAFCANCFI